MAQAPDGPAVLTLRLERRPDHWRLVGGPVPPGYAAITLGPVVFVRERCAGDEVLAAHEAEHVRQWRRHGTVGFLRRYLGSYLRLRLKGWPHLAAYRRIPLEIEAAWVARRTARP